MESDQCPLQSATVEVWRVRAIEGLALAAGVVAWCRVVLRNPGVFSGLPQR
jgi:hypothetical protein